MSRIATIDIGTNTTLLLIAEEREGTIAVLENRAEITRLGRGIGEIVCCRAIGCGNAR